MQLVIDPCVLYSTVYVVRVYVLLYIIIGELLHMNFTITIISMLVVLLDWMAVHSKRWLQ